VIFSCDRCGHRYSVPDERVRGQPFRVTCRACGHVVVVRPGEPPAHADAAAPAAVPPAAPWASTTARFPVADEGPAVGGTEAAGDAPGAPAAAAAPPGRAEDAAAAFFAGPSAPPARPRRTIVAIALVVAALAAAAILWGTAGSLAPGVR